MNRRTAAAFTVSALTALLAGTGASGADLPIRFAVIGDRTDACVPGVYEEIVAEIERLRPDFVVTVGDQIQGYTLDTVLVKREWAEYKSVVAPLTMPLHICPGNHDITTDLLQPFFERNVGPVNSSFDYRNLHFALLDVSRCDSGQDLPDDYLAWLNNDLRQSKAKYKFVFYHKPFWYYTLAEGQPDTLHSICRNCGVSAVFSGHLHRYFSATYDGIPYTEVGSSGGVAELAPTGLTYHFAWVTVDESGIHIAPIRINSVLPWDEITAGEMKAIERINARGLSVEPQVRIAEVPALANMAVTVKVCNQDTRYPLRDTLRWDVSAGWAVEPGQQYLDLAAGDSASVTFRVGHTGAGSYPAPKVSLRFPYGEHSAKSYRAEKPIAVTQQLTIHRTTSAPVIDGKLTDAAWREPLSRFFDAGGSPARTESTALCVCYDDSNLYFGVYCRDSKPESIPGSYTAHDASVLGEDHVGFFIRPPGKGDAYRIYFSSLGTAFDQWAHTDAAGKFKLDNTWDGQYEVKTTRGSDGWTLEVRIPLKQFGTTAQAGQEWGLNFLRRQFRVAERAQWQIPSGYGTLLLK